MNRPSQYIVLGEDKRHQAFVRRLLKRIDQNPRIREMALPSSRGCGEQWVRNHYAAEVRACRQRMARAATALIVVIDADQNTTADRSKELDDAVGSANDRVRSADEPIIHFIPKRAIESWILCLSGQQVDEETDYRHEKLVDKCMKEAPIVFYEWSRANAEIPVHCIPSIRSALPELIRLEST